jgi:hypothetical protein
MVGGRKGRKEGRSCLNLMGFFILEKKMGTRERQRERRNVDMYSIDRLRYTSVNSSGKKTRLRRSKKHFYFPLTKHTSYKGGGR